ncbi:hypothetical protein DL98DRAFT_511957 [Cadophora sp. DSE1049]|nr:hypothetical protein DL98DRAFT_511957 [Cadophora sp. DSE1049]
MTLHLRARASPSTRSLLGKASAWHHKVLATVNAMYAAGTLHPFLCMFAATVINSKAF